MRITLGAPLRDGIPTPANGCGRRPTVTALRSVITWVAPLRDGIPTPANGCGRRPTVTALRSWLGPWLLLVLLAGCGREVGFAGDGESCVRSTECMAGLACVAGRCSADLSGLEGGTLPPRPMDAGPTPDAGPGMDAGPQMDAGPRMDAGPTPDSGPPPTPDSGPPPTPDSGPPPTPDSGPPPTPDAGPPPTPDAGPMDDGG